MYNTLHFIRNHFSSNETPNRNVYYMLTAIELVSLLFLILHFHLCESYRQVNSSGWKVSYFSIKLTWKHTRSCEIIAKIVDTEYVFPSNLFTLQIDPTDRCRWNRWSLLTHTSKFEGGNGTSVFKGGFWQIFSLNMSGHFFHHQFRISHMCRTSLIENDRHFFLQISRHSGYFL